MTDERRKQIEEAAREYAHTHFAPGVSREGFVKGAEWADQNPCDTKSSDVTQQVTQGFVADDEADSLRYRIRTCNNTSEALNRTIERVFLAGLKRGREKERSIWRQTRPRRDQRIRFEGAPMTRLTDKQLEDALRRVTRAIEDPVYASRVITTNEEFTQSLLRELVWSRRMMNQSKDLIQESVSRIAGDTPGHYDWLADYEKGPGGV